MLFRLFYLSVSILFDAAFFFNLPISQFFIYLSSGHNEAEEIFEWIGESKNVQGRYLNDDDFEHLTQASTGSTTGDWLVQL